MADETTPPGRESFEKLDSGSIREARPRADDLAKKETKAFSADISARREETRRRKALRTQAKVDHEFRVFWRRICLILIIAFVMIWYTIMLLALLYHKTLELSDAVLMAMLTTASANILGVSAIIVKYLFFIEKSAETERDREKNS
jgi:hypothetical protein